MSSHNSKVKGPNHQINVETRTSSHKKNEYLKEEVDILNEKERKIDLLDRSLNSRQIRKIILT